MQYEDDHEVINLCSSSDSSEDDVSHAFEFSPVKPKVTINLDSSSSEFDPSEIIQHIIPNVLIDDYHDPMSETLPVLARPSQGLSVHQLFTLMLGTVPADKICSRKPTSVHYSSVFVVNLE